MLASSSAPLRPRLTAAAAILLALTTAAQVAATPRGTIILDRAASGTERFAARELQRYLYVTTGELLPITDSAAPSPSASLVVAVQQTDLARSVTAAGRPALAAQDYRLEIRPAAADAPVRVTIIGGDPVGTLYGVYRFAEKLGVRFYLHGDVIPDARVPFAIAAFREDGHALFPVRGLQPFHDFAEGPDWWNTDDYLAHLGQLAKLRMNFIGLHTYPESSIGPEPTVWIGLRGDYDDQGRVRTAYPASYHTTGRSGRYWWAYAPLRTSGFLGGAAGLFDRDDFGAEVMRDRSFESQTPESAALVFNRTAEMLGRAFARARQLGILTCVGTETPLTVPAAVRAELVRRGRNPNDPALARELYTAMFERMGRACPADYYWLWTPENWTWEGNHPEEFAKTAADIQAALAALDDLKSPMILATCGWVLGPQQDRSALDRLLPASSPMSAINSSVGHVAIERQFAGLSDRPRWAIPWLENDGDLTSPQLWTARMRYDAADALRLGATGLIGIHWRTRLLAPAISALAAAGWDQTYVPADFSTARIPPLTASGATGGRPLATNAALTGEGNLEVFRTNRVGMNAYDMLVPSGDYTVRLGFCELAHIAPGARVFSVRLNGDTVIDHLDLAAQPGLRRAVTFEFAHRQINEGRLLVEFAAQAGEPAIAVIDLEAITSVGQVKFNRRINCGGPELAGWEADELPGQPRPPVDRVMPVADFYRDFATTSFGPEVGSAAGALLAGIDGVKLPVPGQWTDGPGDIRRNPEPWSGVAASYAFVDQFAALRPQVRGAANLDRFDYWLTQFQAMRLIAEIGCTAGALDREMLALTGLTEAAKAQVAALERALPLRLRLATLWTELLRTEISAVSNVGELGTLANLEQRSRVHQKILSRHDDALVKLLGHDLPLAATPLQSYAGAARIVVPTVRTSAASGEIVTVRVLLVTENPAASAATLSWRRLGESAYQDTLLRHVARSVYEFTLPPLGPDRPAIEYHLRASLDGATLRWPVSDRGLDQVVVLQD